MKADEIRKKYLDYFAKKGATIVKSDSIIPTGDNSLLFTSAGMVQFKKHLLGQSKDTFTSATSCQKCFRTSDIENVGNTNRHLTFFEMLGNFSFGDYFKKEAISWAWHFLTIEMGIPQKILFPTIYKDDNEAAEIWKSVAPNATITKMGEDTNFWNMGPTGPCGPCSEILIDLGLEMGCSKPTCGPACGCNRYLEVWNLVFTQFDRQADGSLKNLPKKNIVTGMGLERLCALVNGKKNVFETDLFLPIIEKLRELTNTEINKKTLPKLRMMADHARAVVLLICDGVLPSNEGRGYVLRRILRRAVRQGRLFGINEPFLYKMVDIVVALMSAAYPELKERKENIATIAKMEEEKFFTTLDSGTKILDEAIKKYKSNKISILDGAEVFRLYDTYGFPLELTKEIADENGLLIDETAFLTAQKNAQKMSRAAWSGSGEKDTTFYSSINKELGDSEFVGYNQSEVRNAKILKIIKDGKIADVLEQGENAEVILDKTPFYAESGGQIGDSGEISSKDFTLQVTNTIKPTGGLIVHKVLVTKGSASALSIVNAKINEKLRAATSRHHTATHLLHKALRSVLGTHVTQAGSLVTPESLRFDFAHFSALKPQELKLVEDIANEAVLAALSVTCTQQSIGEARKAGAMALFGEKYGETVRMVSVGESVQNAFSIELCGGTHVKNTGEIGLIKITSEYSVSSGTRRIEAIAGTAALEYLRQKDNTIESISTLLKTPAEQLTQKVEKILVQTKDLEKQISKLKAQIASGSGSSGTSRIVETAGIKIAAGTYEDLDAQSLRMALEKLKEKITEGVAIAFNVSEGKVGFMVLATKAAQDGGFSAGKVAKNISAILGGAGGGKPDFAQGGGKDPSKISEVLSKLAETIQ